ncbi:MAG: GSU2204 family CXXCH-containing (seleno)protein, partial [Thermoanaerobaculia bacterium]|nr:GSU2204 family CXXCH-containing (seleno)protein [Thermoanaerobaculia bacterium]
SYTSLEHEQGVPFILHTYDDALHPEQRKPLFDNRVQYDSADGPIPIDLKPDIDKDRFRVDLSFDSVGGFAVTGGGVWSQNENEYTGLESDYTGFAVNAARRFENGWRVRWRGRSYSIDNDEIFVDTVEPVATAGPHAGKTYRDVYGFDPDFLRLSAMNRDVLESNLELKRKLGKKNTVELEWKYEQIDRDHYQVAVNETETTENIVGVSWTTRPRRGLRAEARYRHAEIDNPFMAINAACSTLESTPAPSPFHPDAAQYYEFHDTRIADTTASPESWDEVRLTGSWSSGRSVLTGSARWWEGDNTSGDLTDWSKSHQSATLTWGQTPSPEWNWYAGWAWFDSEIDAPTCVPIFDG